MCRHVDDLFCFGDKALYAQVVTTIERDYQIGSEDINNVMCVGQLVCWIKEKTEQYMRVDQDRGIE